MSNKTYDTEIRNWKVTRSGTVTSFGRIDGTLDEALAKVVGEHEDGKGYTTRLIDSDGDTVIELYSNGTPQLSHEIRDDYVVLSSVSRNGDSVWGRRRWRIFKAL